MPSITSVRAAIKFQFDLLSEAKIFSAGTELFEVEIDAVTGARLYTHAKVFTLRDPGFVDGILKTIGLILSTVPAESKVEVSAYTTQLLCGSILFKSEFLNNFATKVANVNVSHLLEMIVLLDHRDQQIILPQLGWCLANNQNPGIKAYIAYLKKLKMEGLLSTKELLACLKWNGQQGNILILLAMGNASEALHSSLALLDSLVADLGSEDSAELRDRFIALFKDKVKTRAGAVRIFGDFLTLAKHDEKNLARSSYLKLLEKAFDQGVQAEVIAELLTRGSVNHEYRSMLECFIGASSEALVLDENPAQVAAQLSLSLLKKIIRAGTRDRLSSVDTLMLDIARVGKAIASKSFARHLLPEFFALLKEFVETGVYTADACMAILNDEASGVSLGVVVAASQNVTNAENLLDFLAELRTKLTAGKKYDLNYFFTHKAAYAGKAKCSFIEFLADICITNSAVAKALGQLIQADCFYSDGAIKALTDSAIKEAIVAATLSLTGGGVLFEEALKALDSTTPFGAYLIYATHGTSQAKASKKAVSECLADVMRTCVPQVYEILASGRLTESQRKNLAFMKEDVAKYMRVLPEPERLNALVDAVSAASPLGQYFYLPRDESMPGKVFGYAEASITKGVLKTIFDELRTYGIDRVLAYITTEARMDQLGGLAYFESELVNHWGLSLTDGQIWDQYLNCLNHETVFGRYYIAVNSFRAVSPVSESMKNLNALLVSKTQLFLAKLRSGEVKPEWYAAFYPLQEAFLKSAQFVLSNAEYKALLNEIRTGDTTLNKFFSNNPKLVESYWAKANTVVNRNSMFAASAASSTQAAEFSSEPAAHQPTSALSVYDKL